MTAVTLIPINTGTRTSTLDGRSQTIGSKTGGLRTGRLRTKRSRINRSRAVNA